MDWETGQAQRERRMRTDQGLQGSGRKHRVRRGPGGHSSGCPVPASFEGRETFKANTAPWCKRSATANLCTPAWGPERRARLTAGKPLARISPHPLDPTQEGLPVYSSTTPGCSDTLPRAAICLHRSSVTVPATTPVLLLVGVLGEVVSVSVSSRSP